ncbi:DUF4148 domain-containing protein [Paraburkholderia rhizosphaerae]|uniref:Uncharacterized protein DUF4148 n=1 Tax=Paraburkholderia rhizosphaerae TaxID=480658 RepID=A0A4R8LLE1_9BURK|nr:DUF4148 domain-containing protein [Paraburkholderia rhizosphaerae]TDY45358.1 uncharacterized protein DUF4148 [Paraburkholderia rhizosphaerae]
MNKFTVAAVLAVGLLAGPVASYAQTHDPVTRAEVRANLIAVEKAGYTPSAGEDVNYPADIQAADAKIAAQQDSSYGGVAQGTSASGMKKHGSMMRSNCVGPVSFCNIYFGS